MIGLFNYSWYTGVFLGVVVFSLQGIGVSVRVRRLIRVLLHENAGGEANLPGDVSDFWIGVTVPFGECVEPAFSCECWIFLRKHVPCCQEESVELLWVSCDIVKF